MMNRSLNIFKRWFLELLKVPLLQAHSYSILTIELLQKKSLKYIEA